MARIAQLIVWHAPMVVDMYNQLCNSRAKLLLFGGKLCFFMSRLYFVHVSGCVEILQSNEGCYTCCIYTEHIGSHVISTCDFVCLFVFEANHT